MGTTKDRALSLHELCVQLPSHRLQVSELHVEAGEVVAIIGPNGSGKTSFVESLLGLREVIALRGELLGRPLTGWKRKPSWRRDLGVQLQRASLPGGIRVREVVALHRALFGRADSRIHDSLGVAPLSDRSYDRLSRGETQRIDLYLALAHRPKFLVLDEPFTGLDSEFTQRCISLLAGLDDTTVLMCCHTVNELQLATKVARMTPADGIVAFDAPLAMAAALLGEFKLTVHQADGQSANVIDSLIATSGRREQVRRETDVDGAVTFYGGQELAEVARQAVGIPELTEVGFAKVSLADLLKRCARTA